MLRELKEIFEEELTASYSSDKRLQKCLSATDLTSQRTKNIIKTPQIIQPPDLKNQRSRQTEEFLFCLKLKMISIAGIFGNAELETEKIETKQPNEVLNLLTRKIKNYQKESNKRINDQVSKNKMLEIKIIDLESSIKTLQAEQAHLQKQIMKNCKSYEIDMKKNQRKIQEIENEKQSIATKLHSASQVSSEQGKLITQLEHRMIQFTKTKKSLEASVFQKQKTIAKQINDEKLIRIQHSQQCDGLKQSLMKKTEQINKLNSQIRNLKEVVESKERKNEQMRVTCNKMFHEKQLLSQKIQAITLEHNNLLSKVNKVQQEYENNRLKFTDKQKLLEKSLLQIEQAIPIKLTGLQKVREEVKRLEIKHGSILTGLDNLTLNYKTLSETLEQRWVKQQTLLRQQYEIDKRTAILEMQKFYQNKIMRLEDQIFQLKCKRKE